MKRRNTICFFLILSTTLTISSFQSSAQTPPFSKAVAVNDHQQAFIPRPQQDQKALDKLAGLQKKTSKKPNILWFIIDDMGYGDPGCFGGGAAIGAATPILIPMFPAGASYRKRRAEAPLAVKREAWLP